MTYTGGTSFRCITNSRKLQAFRYSTLKEDFAQRYNGWKRENPPIAVEVTQTSVIEECITVSLQS